MPCATHKKKKGDILYYSICKLCPPDPTCPRKDVHIISGQVGRPKGGRKALCCEARLRNKKITEKMKQVEASKSIMHADMITVIGKKLNLTKNVVTSRGRKTSLKKSIGRRLIYYESSDEDSTVATRSIAQRKHGDKPEGLIPINNVKMLEMLSLKEKLTLVMKVLKVDGMEQNVKHFPKGGFERSIMGERQVIRMKQLLGNLIEKLVAIMSDEDSSHLSWGAIHSLSLERLKATETLALRRENEEMIGEVEEDGNCERERGLEEEQ